MRVNSGTWGTSKNFGELMANRGGETPLEGFTEQDAFGWVIEAYQKLAREAEKRGVVMGLEKHWGLGRTAEGVKKVVDAVNSPWFKVTLDSGNFLEDPLTAIPRSLAMPRDAFKACRRVTSGPARRYLTNRGPA